MAYVKKGDTVKVKGWAGEYKIAGDSFFHTTFGKQVIPVSTPQGKTLRVFLEEINPIDSSDSPWYLNYQANDLSSMNITRLRIKINPNKLGNALGGDPASSLSYVEGDISAGGQTSHFNFYIDYNGSELVPRTNYESEAIMGTILCHVRKRLLREGKKTR